MAVTSNTVSVKRAQLEERSVRSQKPKIESGRKKEVIDYRRCLGKLNRLISTSLSLQRVLGPPKIERAQRKTDSDPFLAYSTQNKKEKKVKKKKKNKKKKEKKKGGSRRRIVWLLRSFLWPTPQPTTTTSIRTPTLQQPVVPCAQVREKGLKKHLYFEYFKMYPKFVFSLLYTC